MPTLADIARALLPAKRTGGRDRVWRRGEAAAAKHLKKQGLRVLARNLRLPGGELDIVCEEGERIVVVEVKARALTPGSGPFRPEDAVTAHKRDALRRLTERLRRREGWLDRPCRIDVIAVELDARGRVAALRHHRGAV